MTVNDLSSRAEQAAKKQIQRLKDVSESHDLLLSFMLAFIDGYSEGYKDAIGDAKTVINDTTTASE